MAIDSAHTHTHALAHTPIQSHKHTHTAKLWKRCSVYRSDAKRGLFWQLGDRWNVARVSLPAMRECLEAWAVPLCQGLPVSVCSSFRLTVQSVARRVARFCLFLFTTDIGLKLTLSAAESASQPASRSPVSQQSAARLSLSHTHTHIFFLLFVLFVRATWSSSSSLFAGSYSDYTLSSVSKEKEEEVEGATAAGSLCHMRGAADSTRCHHWQHRELKNHLVWCTRVLTNKCQFYGVFWAYSYRFPIRGACASVAHLLLP